MRGTASFSTPIKRPRGGGAAGRRAGVWCRRTKAGKTGRAGSRACGDNGLGHRSCGGAPHPLWGRSLAMASHPSDGEMVRREAASAAATQVPVDALVDVSEADRWKCAPCRAGTQRSAQGESVTDYENGKARVFFLEPAVHDVTLPIVRGRINNNPGPDAVLPSRFLPPGATSAAGLVRGQAKARKAHGRPSGASRALTPKGFG